MSRARAPAAKAQTAKAETRPELDEMLAALADPARRRAVEVLGEAPRRAGELAELLGLDPPAMSRHLRVLRRVGLVNETHPEFDQRVRIFALNAPRLSELKQWLARAEAGWAGQLSAFKTHIETKAKTSGGRKT